MKKIISIKILTSSLVLFVSLFLMPEAQALTTISNCTELQAINNDLNENYELSQNIDCSATSTWNSNGSGGYYGFDPIGDELNLGKFRGTLNGNGYAIQNLYINRPSADFVGLFAYGETNSGSIIQNLGLTNVNITGHDYTGSIAGIATPGITDNCYATGSVNGKNYTGGLYGYYNGTISDSYFSGNVTSAINGDINNGDMVGGLIGHSYRSQIDNCYSEGTVTSGTGGNKIGGLIGEAIGYGFIYKITNSYSSSTINNASLYAGGLIGYIDTNFLIEYCYAEGNVNSTAFYVGGLVGYSMNGGKIQYSFATGNVTGTSGDVGGLVGYLNGGIITNSYAKGSVAGYSIIGGLVGYANGTITNSYSTGAVTGNSNLGGLIGNSNIATSSYWDTQTSGRSTSGGGIGKTTVQMMQQATFSGWDFVDTWSIEEGTSYPYFQWKPLYSPPTEVPVVGTSADYTSVGSSTILLDNSSGVSQLPAGATSLTFSETQVIDLSEALVTGDTATTIGSTTVGDALTELKGSSVSDVVEVELRAGSGQTGSDIVLITDSLEVVMQDQTTMYMEVCFDGTMTPPVDITSSITRNGWTVYKALNVGNDGACGSIVHDKVAKITIPGTEGDAYFSADNTNWNIVSACTDATTDSAGSLAFPNACFIEDSNNTIIWTYHYTTFGNMTSITSLTLEDNTPNTSTGWAEFLFTPGTEIPIDGKIMFMVPDEFIMADDADLTDDITTFTVEGINFTANISSATLTNNIIEIYLSSAISADEQVIVRFDNSVFGTNPSTAGEYAISISTHDDAGTVIENGYVMAQINNYVNILATVQEALILTIDDTSIDIIADPSVNSGKDFSQKTILECKTNAKNGYRIQVKLEDSNDGSTASLYSPTTSSNIDSGDAINQINRFGYVAYNTSVIKDADDLETDATSGANSFTNSSSDLTTYQGAGNYVGLEEATNSQLHTVYYTLAIDYLTAAGIYSGVITYTAVPSF